MKSEVRALLRARAVAMAIEPKQQGENMSATAYIEFTLTDESYCVESSYVREVFPLRDFTSLPGTPGYILGIVNLRGQIIPVIDLKKFFNLPEKGLGQLNKVIVLSNEKMEFGILSDEIIGTKLIYNEEILPVPPKSIGISKKFLTGVTKKHLIILSAERVLSDKSIIIN